MCVSVYCMSALDCGCFRSVHGVRWTAGGLALLVFVWPNCGGFRVVIPFDQRWTSMIRAVLQTHNLVRLMKPQETSNIGKPLL
jgi:hypothetical protein